MVISTRHVTLAVLCLYACLHVTNLTDTNMSGQCKASEVYKEVTLKGGINAGTYKDVGGVSTMEECQKKCCEFPACDLAFMLAGSCYLVGCADQKQCTMQPAKESKFHPSISYVTRWNNEGVKHTVLLQDKQNEHYTCSKINPMLKVTLKGGLQAGDFTDVGKVTDLGQCYEVCCQQSSCDLAFMLGQNCFSVACKNKGLCQTTPAQPSIFNPQIAYVTSRISSNNGSIGAPSLPDVGAKAAMPLLQSAAKLDTKAGISPQVCPRTKLFESMTLKGGIEAGAYKDHGKVPGFEQCRRICCEMTECHLAFLLGENCFSVKCASVDACRLQKAKPSAYSPKIAYIRKVGTNELLVGLDAAKAKPDVPAISGIAPRPASLLETLGSAGGLNTKSDIGGDTSGSPAVPASMSGQEEVQVAVPAKPAPSGFRSAQLKAAQTPVSSSVKTLSIDPHVGPAGNSVYPGSPSVVPVPVKTDANTPAQAGTAITPGINLMAALGGLNESADKQAAAQKTSAGKLITDASVVALKKTTANTTTDATIKKEIDASPVTSKNEKDANDLKNALEAAGDNKEKPPPPPSMVLNGTDNKCSPGRLKNNVTLKGGRKSGEFIEIKFINNMDDCVKRCCDDRDKMCNLAFMLGNSCYAVACKDKELCKTIPAPASKFNPMVQYVRELEEEPEPLTTKAPETTTSVPSTTKANKKGEVKDAAKIEKQEEDKKSKVITNSKKDNITRPENKNAKKLKPKCVTQPIVKDKSIKGGKKAGKFKIYKDIKTMNQCISKCCSLKNQCDVAYMEDGKCFSIQCNRKSACTAVDLRDDDIDPQFAYMDHFLEKIDEEEAVDEPTTDLKEAELNDEGSCNNVEITKGRTLKGGTKAGKFRSVGKVKDMKKCVSKCCDQPDCDIAYLLNDHCFHVECTDGKLCQATIEPAHQKDNVQLAYMNKAGLGETKRDYVVVYIICGSLALALTLGGLLWVGFAYMKKNRLKQSSHARLLQDDQEEDMDEIIRQRPSHSPRYRQPRY